MTDPAQSVSGRPVGSGLVIVDKDGDQTSHDVVARVRRLAGTRKVGHAGTLDPMATGVLVLGVNRATRLLGHLMLTEKGYDATIRLGMSTTTDDAEGEVVTTTAVGDLSEAEARAGLAALVGEVDQVPSAVSAIKVAGKRAYQRVRDGEQVELSARRVSIHEIVVHEIAHVDEALDVRVSVRCSSGTYIRAIARDLGAVLGVGGHLTALRRTAVGVFDLADARTLPELQASFALIPLEVAARRCFRAVDLTGIQARDAGFGRPLDLDLGRGDGSDTAPVAVFAPDGTFLALYQPRSSGARPIAVFCPTTS
ncbi:MAG: tRNA pseudouridine(55) synthase TruB [Nocardioides sp.]|uniref:tRNA pseudouridine(55) synthase TruB n=1 Tax=Nocardioides sp. TaxID=35761 RepID=UPI0039E689BE